MLYKKVALRVASTAFGVQVIGGICYRPYFEQQFAEIAFCAISTEEQVSAPAIPTGYADGRYRREMPTGDADGRRRRWRVVV